MHGNLGQEPEIKQLLALVRQLKWKYGGQFFRIIGLNPLFAEISAPWKDIPGKGLLLLKWKIALENDRKMV